MQLVQRVRKTDLACNTRQVLRNVQRGRTAIIESHGQPEAANDRPLRLSRVDG